MLPMNAQKTISRNILIAALQYVFIIESNETKEIHTHFILNHGYDIEYVLSKLHNIKKQQKGSGKVTFKYYNLCYKCNDIGKYYVTETYNNIKALLNNNIKIQKGALPNNGYYINETAFKKLQVGHEVFNTLKTNDL